MKDDKKSLLITLALVLIILILSISTAIFSQKLIDEIIPSKNLNKLTWGIVLLSLILISRALLSLVRAYVAIDQSKNFNNRIINNFFNSLLLLPKSFFDMRSTVDLIARLNDTQRIQNAINYFLNTIVVDAFLFIIFTILIFLYSTVLGIVILAFIPCYVWLFWNITPQIIKKQQEVMGTYAASESNYVDTIQGIDVIKLMNKEHVFEDIAKSIYSIFQSKVQGLGIVNSKHLLLVVIVNRKYCNKKRHRSSYYLN